MAGSVHVYGGVHFACLHSSRPGCCKRTSLVPASQAQQSVFGELFQYSDHKLERLFNAEMKSYEVCAP